MGAGEEEGVDGEEEAPFQQVIGRPCETQSAYCHSAVQAAPLAPALEW